MNAMVYCRACGKQVHDTATSCPHCGAPQRTGRSLKSKSTAALLAIFLGGFGVHRFYLGQWWGVAYLLFCWTGISGVIAFVEGLVFAFGDLAKWDAKYNQGEPSGESGVGKAVLIVVSVVGGVALLGILAAIALPAYQDYVTRAKVSEALHTLQQATPAVGEFIEAQQRVPSSLQEAGFQRALPPSIDGIAINQRTGEIRATLAGNVGIAGRTLSMLPTQGDDQRITWRCTSDTLPAHALPAACRP